MDDKRKLQKLIDDLKTKKFRESEAKGLMSEIQKEQTQALIPLLQEISQQGTERMVAAFEKAIQSIKIEIPNIEMPEIYVPEITIPPFPKVPAPVVNYTPPAIHIPDIKMPGEMEIKGWVNFQGYDRGLLLNPLPVQLRDARGNPINLLENLTKILAGAKGNGGMMTQPLNNGGGKADYFTIKAFSQSAFAEITNPDGRIKVELPTGSSGLTDTELRAAHLDVQQTSGSIDSVKVTGFDTSVGAALVDSTGTQYSGSNPLPVTLVSGGSATSATNIVDSSGVAYSGSNPLPITGPVVVTSITNTIAAAVVDSTGVEYSGSNPLPVTIISDAINLDQTTDSIAVRQVSGATDSVNILQIGSNPVVVGTGYQDNALRVVNATDAVTSVNVVNSNALDIKQVSGSSDSVNILQINGNPVVVGTGYQDNALRVVNATDAVTSVNVVNANSIDVQIVSGAVVSTNNLQTASNPTVVGSGYQDNALRVVNATDAITSVRIDGSSASVAASMVDSTGVQYSGSNPLPVNLVSQSLASSASALVDSTGVQYSGSNPLPVTITSGAGATSASNIVDSTGVAYTGSNPMPITLVSGGLTSTLSVGDSAARSADNGGNPVKVGGIVQQTNPSAYANGDRANFSSDDLGRQLVRPVQVRDLIVTAYATFATGTEATLLAGVAAFYFDLLYILAANNSTVAVGIDIRPSTAGSIVMHLEIPANGVVGVSLPVPIPQQATGDGTGGSWTVDLPDITGTTVSVSALFSKEV